MKKFFFFAAMLASTAAFATTEVVLVNVEGYPTEAEVKATDDTHKDPKAVDAKTVLAQGENIVVMQAFAGEYQAVGMSANAYTQFFKGDDAEAINAADAMGLQEKTNNPKDADGKTVLSTNAEVKAPASGGVLLVEPAADGFVYILHKATSNKDYFVWEIAGEQITGYEYSFGMITCPTGKKNDGKKVAFLKDVEVINFVTDSLIKYDIKGDEDGYIEDFSLCGFPEFHVYKTEGEYADSLANSALIRKNGAYAQSGLSVIAFKAYQGMKYYVHAGGSKVSFLGAIFTDEANLAVKAAAGEQVVELFGGFDAPVAVENVKSSSIVVKTIENGQIVIEKDGVKYNVLGAKL